ncbi:MAG: glucose-1-phosphate thymidylyltransferase RfbA [Bdellovibrionales bacterium]
MKGILLAGGSGTRLAPMTDVLSKQLLPVYDKPTIYYPLSVLMLTGIRDILIISTPRDLPVIQNMFGSGERLGLRLSYKVQEAPRGIAEALILGEAFADGGPVCLILGDNIFYGHNLEHYLREARSQTDGARIFAYYVSNPNQYGVVSLDAAGRPVSIVEKPREPKSPWAVTGLYFYDGNASTLARSLTPSARGELEITDLNRKYMEAGKLSVSLLKRGFAWLDTGTADSLLSSSLYVQALEKRQGLKIACLEEIALKLGFIDMDLYQAAVQRYANSEYGTYLKRVLIDLELNA